MSEIAVIVPVYQSEQYIKRCLDSILSQTYTDFDLICIDDGSTDGSARICDEYQMRDARITVIHQTNSGPSAARNRGIEWALEKGKNNFITFVDSDDFIHPFFLEFMYRGLIDNQTNVVMCAFQYIMNINDLEWNSNAPSIHSIKMSAEDLLVSTSTAFNYIWGKLYRINCFCSIRFPESVFYGEDNLTVYKILFETGDITYLTEKLYYYTYSPEGITKSIWTPDSLDVFKGIQEQIEFYKNNGYEKAYKKEIELYLQQYAYQLHRINENKSTRKKYRMYHSQLRQDLKTEIKKYPEFLLKENIYWYEAVYPWRAFIRLNYQKVKNVKNTEGIFSAIKRVLDRLFR